VQKGNARCPPREVAGGEFPHGPFYMPDYKHGSTYATRLSRCVARTARRPLRSIRRWACTSGEQCSVGTAQTHSGGSAAAVGRGSCWQRSAPTAPARSGSGRKGPLGGHQAAARQPVDLAGRRGVQRAPPLRLARPQPSATRPGCSTWSPATSTVTATARGHGRSRSPAPRAGPTSHRLPAAHPVQRGARHARPAGRAGRRTARRRARTDALRCDTCPTSNVAGRTTTGRAPDVGNLTPPDLSPRRDCGHDDPAALRNDARSPHSSPVFSGDRSYAA
jgi:hypothetical protein